MLGHFTYTWYIFRSAYILETGQETHNEDIASDVIWNRPYLLYNMLGFCFNIYNVHYF